MSLITILDTETTGIDHAANSLVEVAAARFSLTHGKLIDARSVLVKQTRGEHGAEEVHGIPAELPEQYGGSLASMPAYVSGSLAIVAHSAEFDRGWFSDLGVPWADSIDFEWPRPSSSRSLAAVALAHGVGIVRAHRALDDVMTLAAILERCHELGADLTHMVTRALRPKVLLQALVSYDDRDKAKAARFQWEADRKRWTKRAFADEKFDFPVREVA